MAAPFFSVERLLFEHDGGGGLHRVPGSLDVGRYHRVEFFFGHFVDFGQHAIAGVGNDDIEAAEGRDGFGDEFFDVGTYGRRRRRACEPSRCFRRLEYIWRQRRRDDQPRRAASITLAPARASSIASAAPIPEEAPAMATVLPATLP